MRAIVVGSATIDIIATIANDDIEQMRLTNQTASFLLMVPGRKVDATSIQTFTGGGAVNVSISLSRLGFMPSPLIKVGHDINAEKIKARLEEEQIDTSLVRVDDEQSTAVSLLIASHDRDAAIFTHRGANGFLTSDDFDEELFTDAKLAYITNLSNASADQFPALAKAAKAKGAFVATNPGIRQLTLKTDPFFESLKFVDLFICNMHEARSLVPKLVEHTGWDINSARAPFDGEQVLEVNGFRLPLGEYFDRMHRLGLAYVGVTDGANGAYLSDNGTTCFQPVVKTTVYGTTGAGDAFASTLSAAIVKGYEPQRALQLAAQNAASVVSHVDAQTGLLSIEDLERKIDG